MPKTRRNAPKPNTRAVRNELRRKIRARLGPRSPGQRRLTAPVLLPPTVVEHPDLEPTLTSGSYHAISRATGYPVPFVSRALRGLRGMHFATACLFADAAGVSLDTLRKHVLTAIRLRAEKAATRKLSLQEIEVRERKGKKVRTHDANEEAQTA